MGITNSNFSFQIRHGNKSDFQESFYNIGTLSGSRLTLLQAVKNCVEHARIPLDEALRMAGAYPAQLIHANDIGRIEAGYKAYLVIFNDTFEVQQVITEGNIFNKWF